MSKILLEWSHTFTSGPRTMLLEGLGRAGRSEMFSSNGCADAHSMRQYSEYGNAVVKCTACKRGPVGKL
jgi:hypothetical protein